MCCEQIVFAYPPYAVSQGRPRSQPVLFQTATRQIIYPRCEYTLPSIQ